MEDGAAVPVWLTHPLALEDWHGLALRTHMDCVIVVAVVAVVTTAMLVEVVVTATLFVDIVVVGSLLVLVDILDGVSLITVYGSSADSVDSA